MLPIQLFDFHYFAFVGTKYEKVSITRCLTHTHFVECLTHAHVHHTKHQAGDHLLLLQIYSDNSLTLKLTNKTIELQVAPKTKSTPLWY